MVAVLVFGDVVTFDMAVGRTRRDHRDFTLEGNKCLQDGGSGAELRPDLIGIVALANERLALAVITETAGPVHRPPAPTPPCLPPPHPARDTGPISAARAAAPPP